MTNWWPPFHAAFGPIDQMLVTGSLNWRKQYWPQLTNQSPAGIGSVSPAASAMRFELVSGGAPFSSVGYKFCGNGKERPGPAIYWLM